MEVVPGLHWVDRIWDTKVYILLETERVIVVDAAMPSRAEHIWLHLASLGYAPEHVDQIWLTHGDIDHMGSVAQLKAQSGAEIVAHSGDAPLVSGERIRGLGSFPLAQGMQRLHNWVVRYALRYEPATVDRTVEDGDTLGEWSVVHVPGHTSGSVCYYHRQRRIAFVGDAVTHRMGRLGIPPSVIDVDARQARASVQTIANLGVDVCCFGHGPPLVKNTQQRLQALAESLQSAGE